MIVKCGTAVGIYEDPVTGSVHGPLAVYLVSMGLIPSFKNYSKVTCTQSDSTGRAGLVRAIVTREKDVGYKVRIAGECRTVMKGKLYV